VVEDAVGDRQAAAAAAALDDSTASKEAVKAARPKEPRPEIWFRRRVSLRQSLREVWLFRELVITLAERDLRARYKQAVLGFAWAIVTPLMLMGVFTLLFTKFKVASINAHGAPYVLFTYLGVLPWTFFSTSLQTGGMSLVANLPIVNKVYCPREVFPIASIAVAIVDSLISTVVLGVLFAATGFAPHAQVFYLPPLLAVLMIFTVGSTLIVSSLLVYLRDLRHALPLLINLGLFVTPVGYGFELIAKSTWGQVLYSILNPIAPVIDGFRRTVLFGTSPDWLPLAAGAGSSMMLLVVGYYLFKRLETGIADIA
jgi:ABC-2 type transport system permease protein/lipopolysaccharide transport system permease protein